MQRDLASLIERLEKAVGPSRELDFAIHDALFPAPAKDRRGLENVELPEGFGKDTISQQMDPRPWYTALIDAALTLVPEGWAADCFRWPDGRGDASCFGEEDAVITAFNCVTPAIAICIAALKARSLSARQGGTAL